MKSMKTLLSLILLGTAGISLHAEALETQEIFIEKAIVTSAVCGRDNIPQIRQEIERAAQAKCDGNLQRISDWLQVDAKPVLSYCTESWMLAAFECHVPHKH